LFFYQPFESCPSVRIILQWSDEYPLRAIFSV
jgi:hypothetical protein